MIQNGKNKRVVNNNENRPPRGFAQNMTSLGEYEKHLCHDQEVPCGYRTRAGLPAIESTESRLFVIANQVSHSPVESSEE